MAGFLYVLFWGLALLAVVASGLDLLKELSKQVKRTMNGEPKKQEEVNASCFAFLVFLATFIGASVLLNNHLTTEAEMAGKPEKVFDDPGLQAAWEKEQVRLQANLSERKRVANQFNAEIDALVPLCKEMVKQQAKFPSKASSGWYDHSVGYKQKNGQYRAGVKPPVKTFSDLYVRIAGKIDFMNSFGAYIPHKYQCDFKGDQLQDLKVVEGG